MRYAAVYKIVNQCNGKIYIGSSSGVEQRLRKHKSDLQLGVHHNKHLQRAWNKYGSENFTFEILEKVDDENDLLVIEQLWIDACRSSDIEVYNIALKAGSCKGIKRSEKACQQQSIRKREWFLSEDGKKHRQKQSEYAKTRTEHLKVMREKSQTEEARAKHSLSAKARCQTKEWQELQQRIFAERATPEGRRRNAQSQKKLPVLEILEAAAVGIAHKEIGSLYGCNRTSVENTIHLRCLGGVDCTSKKFSSTYSSI
jgi:group I intron endonuclease